MALFSSTIVGLLAFLAASEFLHGSNYASANDLIDIHTLLENILPTLGMPESDTLATLDTILKLLNPGSLATNVLPNVLANNLLQISKLIGNLSPISGQLGSEALNTLVEILKLLVPTWFTENNPIGWLVELFVNFIFNPISYTVPFPECNMTTPQLIEFYGYTAEIHYVTTKNGYILGVHRIPHGINGSPATIGEPVLLQHGFSACSSDWVINSPDQSLGFLLADRNYDVWLGNVRGNTYSRRHVDETMDLEGEQFWNFSLDEIAAQDITAMIDYILKTTNRPKLSYIGHSMGTMEIFALLSSQPEYNHKVKQVIALGPVTNLQNIKTIIATVLIPVFPTFLAIMKVINWHYLFVKSAFSDYFAMNVCEQEPFKYLCVELLSVVAGEETDANLNRTRLPHYLAHMPNGFSVKTTEHIFQTLTAERFQKFDYESQNFLKYKMSEPPIYDLKNVKVPVVLIYGGSDLLTVHEDVKIIYDALPEGNTTMFKAADDCNHLDMVWGKMAAKKVNDKIIELLGAKRDV